MTRGVLTEEPWVTIWTLLRAHLRGSVGRPEACRRFLNAVRWVRRGGAQWRLLPTEWGHWNRVFKRSSRWGEHGVWADWHRYTAHDPDWQEVFWDSTRVRAQACAAGPPKAPRWRKRWGVPVVASARRFTP